MAAVVRIIYQSIYRISEPRWDDGSIPSQVAQLATNKGKTRNTIDLGCGGGTHSIYLAQRGLQTPAVSTLRHPSRLFRVKIMGEEGDWHFEHDFKRGVG